MNQLLLSIPHGPSMAAAMRRGSPRRAAPVVQFVSQASIQRVTCSAP